MNEKKNPANNGDLMLLVTERKLVADHVIELVLRAADDSALPPWTAGAHIDVVLEGEPQLVRQYSLSGSPSDADSWRIAVLRERDSRGGSARIHDEIAVGDRLVARGPRNNFALDSADAYLFVAGGIGITPIIPMIEAASRSGAEWHLVYGGRNQRSMAYADELAGRYKGRVALRPQDEHGLLDLESILASRPSGALVYSCGPGALLDAMDKLCAALPGATLHTERFVPRDLGEPLATRPFDVELALSDTTLQVRPEQSILGALEEAGITVVSSCQEGTCGTCETAVLDGEVDHRDSILTLEERAANSTMFICVSRAAGTRLVLDL